jgi:hypothetical protein
MSGRVDWFLEMWAQSDGGIEVSLCVNGMIIAGEVVSEAEYFRRFVESVVHDVHNTAAAEAFRERMANFAPQAEARDAERREKRDTLAATLPPYEDQTPEQRQLTESVDLEFLHLANATAHLMDGHRIKLPLWRGRLSDVTGFTFGNLGH